MQFMPLEHILPLPFILFAEASVVRTEQESTSQALPVKEPQKWKQSISCIPPKNEFGQNTRFCKGGHRRLRRVRNQGVQRSKEGSPAVANRTWQVAP
jgi:hypothetical protein